MLKASLINIQLSSRTVSPMGRSVGLPNRASVATDLKESSGFKSSILISLVTPSRVVVMRGSYTDKKRRSEINVSGFSVKL